LIAEQVPVRQAHFKSNCKRLSDQNNSTDSEDSSWVLIDIHTSYCRKLKPANLSVPYSSSFSCIPYFLSKVSRLARHPFLSIPNFLSYIFVFFVFITVVSMKSIFFWYFLSLRPILSQKNLFHF